MDRVNAPDGQQRGGDLQPTLRLRTGSEHSFLMGTGAPMPRAQGCAGADTYWIALMPWRWVNLTHYQGEFAATVYSPDGGHSFRSRGIKTCSCRNAYRYLSCRSPRAGV
jgi:hypothetical protein